MFAASSQLSPCQFFPILDGLASEGPSCATSPPNPTDMTFPNMLSNQWRPQRRIPSVHCLYHRPAEPQASETCMLNLWTGGKLQSQSQTPSLPNGSAHVREDPLTWLNKLGCHSCGMPVRARMPKRKYVCMYDWHQANTAIQQKIRKRKSKANKAHLNRPSTR